MPRPAGFFTFVLHAHLPYVMAHGRWPHGMDWLNEATAETYLPLLRVLRRLEETGRKAKVTLGITPVLLEQLRDPFFAEEFTAYLRQKTEAARQDGREFARTGERHLAALADRWVTFYEGLEADFEGVGRDLVGAFARMQEAGQIELLTSAATHGYLPLLSRDTSVQAQVKVGIRTTTRHTGRAPRGIWLPECAYRPRYAWTPPVGTRGVEEPPRLRKGVEEFLQENGLDYFVVDSHLLKGGKAIGVYLDRFEALRRLWGQFAEAYPVRPETGERSPYELYWVASAPRAAGPVAIFTRDPRTGVQVWSGEHGYPGNGFYLDFHKKRWPGGHRYWRVTSAKADLGAKQPYEPERAAGVIPEQAAHFAGLVRDLLQEHAGRTGRPGMVTAPYDAELFGHWWFEGPDWLEAVLRRLADDPAVELATCSEVLDRQPPTTVITLPEGSWGEGGFHFIWLNEATEWTWRYVYEAEETMEGLAREFATREDPTLQAILRQAARTLLLLQASDWQFLISTWSARDYAEMRLANHYHDFVRLAALARRHGRGEPVDPGEWEYLGLCEKRDNLFPDLDPRWWAAVEHPAT